ncbi:hypothetical protein GOALK_110_00540 [Gordonia alkanivorans NBRC 16433]|uniref:Uncharacterized protein n=1 Tax=Gordonia alkanivorans NBRC 16433 TaxID=1027371 RepID=F9W155_9ACTN|nr:hypothetical protein GOALK_110_00540 [Gordonia alkanivorans NBRC 16433]
MFDRRGGGPAIGYPGGPTPGGPIPGGPVGGVGYMPGYGYCHGGGEDPGNAPGTTVGCAGWLVVGGSSGRGAPEPPSNGGPGCDITPVKLSSRSRDYPSRRRIP